MYNQAPNYDGYLIGSSARIPSIVPLAKPFSGLSALDFLSLGFIAQATYFENNFAITIPHRVV